MARTVKLSQIDDALEELSYPISRSEAAAAFGDTTLTFSDGEENLGEAIGDVGAEEFGSVNDLRDEIYAYLPTEALGEPGQSEGDA